MTHSRCALDVTMMQKTLTITSLWPTLWQKPKDNNNKDPITTSTRWCSSNNNNNNNNAMIVTRVVPQPEGGLSFMVGEDNSDSFRSTHDVFIPNNSITILSNNTNNTTTIINSLE